MTRVYLHTFGCKTNQYDSEVVRQALEDAGAVVVEDPRVADAAIVNSCTVTHVGEAKMRGLVRRLAREQPAIRTVVMGCAAAVDDGRLARLPGVVAVEGGADAGAVLRALGFPPSGSTSLLRRFAQGTRAWLKIQDGCDEHCTFCATVIARGANRSRPPREILAEARLLAEHAEEIVLTGVHIGTYGTGGRGGLGALVERLIVEVPRVRFRLSSVEATEVDDALADLMATAPDRLAPHLHAPLQSGSDRVLRRMGRHWYTAAEYRRRVERLAARLPVFALGADVMVGFPGETDADFALTMKLVDDVGFDGAFSFAYSPRPGTPAAELDDQAPAETKHTRLEQLQARLDAQYRACSEAMVGTRQRVLVTGRAVKDTSELQARTENNRVVNFAGDCALVGTYADVTITAALPHSLRGEIADAN